MKRSNSLALSGAAALLVAVVFFFQNCGRYAATKEGQLESVTNIRTGTLAIDVFDTIGAREQVVPDGDSLVPTVEYRVAVKSAAYSWDIQSVPSGACRLESIDGFANERTLTCVETAQLSLTIKDGDTANGLLTKTVLSNELLSTAGSALYTSNCVSCHGVQPDARIEAATAFKIDEAFSKSAAMASFASLSPTSVRAISAYVIGIKNLPSPTPGPSPVSTPDGGGELNGASLYASTKCANCHGPLETSNQRGATTSQILAAINGKVPAMVGLKYLTAAEVAAIAQALGAPTPVAAISPGFRYLIDRFDVFKTIAGDTKQDRTVDNLVKRTILSGMEFMGGTCSKYQDPELCAIKYTDYYTRAGAEENPSVSSIRRGYITRLCEELVSNADLLKTALSRRGLTEASPFTDANVTSVFQAFVPGRQPSTAVLTALKNLGSSAQARANSPLMGWQFVFHSVCISSAADLL